MNFEEFRTFAETKFQTDWAATPVEWENFPESAALTAAKNAKSPWVRFVIRDGSGARKTVGADSRVNRFAGSLIHQIFVAQKTGTAVARDYADAIAGIWDGFSGESDLEFRTPVITNVGDNSGWFQLNVEIGFLNDEIMI